MGDLYRRYEILAEDDTCYDGMFHSAADAGAKFEEDHPNLKYHVFEVGSMPQWLSYREFKLLYEAFPENWNERQKLKRIHFIEEFTWDGLMDYLTTTEELGVTSYDLS